MPARRSHPSYDVLVAGSESFAPYLWICTVLLVGRVAGQLIVATKPPAWLPPMEQWQSGLLPYPVLVAGQGVVLTLMIWISIDFSRGSGFWVQPMPRLGLAAVWWSYLYFGAMVVRYIRRMIDAAGSALVRRHDPHHLSLDRGGVSVDVRDVSRALSETAIRRAARRASRPMFNSPPRKS